MAKNTLTCILALAALPLCASTDVRKALSQPLLPKGNRIVYDILFKAVCTADLAADRAWSACTTPAALKARQVAVRRQLLAALGEFPERCPPHATVTGRAVREGYAVEKILFESEPNHHVTAHLFLPDPVKFPGRRPGIVIPCGHSMNGKASPGYQRGALQAAQAGMVAFVYDPVDQGERRQCRGDEMRWGTRAHNEIGRRAELLGWSAARFRTWDGMRALDVLAARPEVDAKRLGVMGHSGGGTMTSWLMALDDRIACAAPSGFLSTMRGVVEDEGPQDAEQYVFGELRFGFNHLGHILLRAPVPVLHCASFGDFFPYEGVVETSARAADAYAMLGARAAYSLSDTIGPHHWHESTRTRAVAWMDRWLQGGPGPGAMQADRNRQYGFSYAAVDTGLGYEAKRLADMRTNCWAASVTPTGSTLDLPGERTVYDIMRDEAARQKAARSPLTPARVRATAGIRPASEIVPTVCAASEKDGVKSAVLVQSDGTPVPVVTVGAGAPALVVADVARRADLAARVAALAAAGHAVTVADLRGFGETAKGKNAFYGIPDSDEEFAQMAALVGESLVGMRAEDVIAAAKHVAGGGRVRLIAVGRAAVAAAHAYYAARELFASVTFENPPPAWAELLDDDACAYRFSEVVHGAWRAYDWTDLAKE